MPAERDPEIDDNLFAHQPLSRASQFFSAGSNVLAIAVELMRIVQAFEYRRDRWAQLARGRLDRNLVCPHYLPDSALPSSPGGDVIPIVWHMWNIAILAICFASELPSKKLMKRLGKCCVWVGPMTGTWAEGCLQLLVAFGMLSQPIGVYIGTPERIVRLEYVTGWILVAAGLVNLLLTGMVDQSLIRAQRKQADSFEQLQLDELAGKNTLANVFMQWSYYASPRRRADLTEVIEGTLDTVQYNGRFGELFNRRETMRKLLNSLTKF